MIGPNYYVKRDLPGSDRRSHASRGIIGHHLSRLLDEVKSGTTILILDRNKPVARLEPVAADRDTNSDRVARLIRQGLLSIPRHTLDVEEFLSWKRPRLAGGVNAVQFLIEEREDR